MAGQLAEGAEPLAAEGTAVAGDVGFGILGETRLRVSARVDLIYMFDERGRRTEGDAATNRRPYRFGSRSDRADAGAS